ncbi:hypothetical protein [uncultured Rothia sp.]|nr:hypothetical protein [uncultured Rothia sp.]
MLHHLRETLRRIPAPRRYGRIMALLLASLGGAVGCPAIIYNPFASSN